MPDDIPYGTCHCGCGRKTNIATMTNNRDGRVKGQPVRFVSGHNARRDTWERFIEKVKVNPASGCWEWQAQLSQGYGRFFTKKTGEPSGYAHRYAYERFKGPIPEDLQIDHLCRNRRCVNPDHLEAVTLQENVRRGDSPSTLNALKTHCKRGHAFDDANTYWTEDGKRRCRQCVNAHARRYRAKKQAA